MCYSFHFFIHLFVGRFINERIEFLVLNMNKANKGAITGQGASQSRPDDSSGISSDQFSRLLDPTVTGVELVQFKNKQSRSAVDTSATDHVNGNKDPLLSIDPRSTRSWNSLPNSQTSDERGIQQHSSGGEWGDMLDLISRRKTQALAPEHFENMWTKGRNYRKKEGENRVVDQVPQGSSAGKSVKVEHSNAIPKPKEKNNVICTNHSESGTSQTGCTGRLSVEKSFIPANQNISNRSSFVSYEDADEHDLMRLEEIDSGSSTSYTSEDEETSNVTGLDSPGTKVWDGRSNRNLAISHIHHPLEKSEGRTAKKTGKGNLHYQRLSRTPSSHKRSRPRSQKTHIWQEVERTSFLSGDGQDILSSVKGHANDDSSDDSEIENFRAQSGAAASSSAFSFSIPESHSFSANSLQNTLAVASFYKLRCEVLTMKPSSFFCFSTLKFWFSDNTDMCKGYKFIFGCRYWVQIL